MMGANEGFTFSDYAERILDDYRRVSAFIRAHAPDDEDVQREAQSALNHLRIVAGKLAYLAVMLERGDQ